MTTLTDYRHRARRDLFDWHDLITDTLGAIGGGCISGAIIYVAGRLGGVW